MEEGCNTCQRRGPYTNNRIWLHHFSSPSAPPPQSLTQPCQNLGPVVNLRDECAICLMPCAEQTDDVEAASEELRAMPCLHVLHKDCLYKCLVRSNSCPICRCPRPGLDVDNVVEES
jgi:hypothetical protein